MKILVVDDDPIQRDAMNAMLITAGNTVILADSGETAVTAVLAADDLDLILMDMRMPGIDGEHARDRIRRLPGWRGRVPIKAMSAGVISGNTLAHFDGYVQKGPNFTTSLAGAVTDAMLARSTASVPPKSLLNRLKDWWWTLGVIGFLGGLVVGGFVKFNVYYLAEQASVLSMQTLSLTSIATTQHLASIDKTLLDQNYQDKDNIRSLSDLANHVHVLDERADADRKSIIDQLGQEQKNSESILLLLQSKSSRK